MLKKVRDYVDRWHMLQSKDRLIVGVSGGADSVCLLFVLLELQKEIGFDMVAVHVNHGLRGQAADADEAYVKELCRVHGIPCECYFENVELIAKNRKQSTEEAGREVRKTFFEQALATHRGTKIALAHHQNDSAETFLFHLSRGTGLKGLCGISPVKGNIIRPLLCVERKEIEAYLKKLGVSYCTDQTNASDEYTRNRVRRHMIPYMEEHLNEKTVAHMNDTMEQIRLIQDYLEEQTELFWEKCVSQTEDGSFVSEEEYRKVPEAIGPLLLKKVLTFVAGREKDLEATHIRQLQELFDKQTGRKVDLPYQMQARRMYKGIEISRKCDTAGAASEEYIYQLDQKEAEFLWNDKKVRCRVLDATKRKHDTSQKNYTKQFDYDIIKNNIQFRTRRPGDYITIHADGSTQKLKSYFINEKIPQKQRDQILLVAEGSHVLWIVGYRVNAVYQIHAHTKHVLEIEINEGENYGRDN